jgi:hypothetical protein
MQKQSVAHVLSGMTEEQHAELFATAKKTLGIAETNAKYEIPTDKVDEIGKYLLKTQKNHPDWKKDKVMRKAAEHFKLKKKIPVIPDDGNISNQ